MYNRRKSVINSDSRSEDRGYNPNHRQTEGGYEAYERGEQPMSYWTKQVILREIVNTLKLVINKRDSQALKIMRLMNYSNATARDLKETLNKLSRKELLEKFLIFTGTHYTGNYYRYTKFYGISEQRLVNYILELYKPPVTVQLNLF